MELLRLISRYDRHVKPEKHSYRYMERAEVLALPSGAHVHCVDGQDRVCEVKINGRVRTWKRDPERVEIPCKYGLRDTFTLSLREALIRFVVPMETDEDYVEAGIRSAEQAVEDGQRRWAETGTSRRA